jgi:hypothetical protein
MLIGWGSHTLLSHHEDRFPGPYLKPSNPFIHRRMQILILPFCVLLLKKKTYSKHYLASPCRHCQSSRFSFHHHIILRKTSHAQTTNGEPRQNFAKGGLENIYTDFLQDVQLMLISRRQPKIPKATGGPKKKKMRKRKNTLTGSSKTFNYRKLFNFMMAQESKTSSFAAAKYFLSTSRDRLMFASPKSLASRWTIFLADFGLG